MSGSAVLLIIAASFATLGTVFLLVGLAVGKGLRRDWVQTQGRWTVTSGRRGATVAEYTVDGTVHQLFPVMNATSIAPSGPVPVAYDPRRPGRGVIDTFAHRGGLLKAVGGALVSVAAVIAVAGGVLALAS